MPLRATFHLVAPLLALIAAGIGSGCTSTPPVAREHLVPDALLNDVVARQEEAGVSVPSVAVLAFSVASFADADRLPPDPTAVLVPMFVERFETVRLQTGPQSVQMGAFLPGATPPLFHVLRGVPVGWTSPLPVQLRLPGGDDTITLRALSFEEWRAAAPAEASDELTYRGLRLFAQGNDGLLHLLNHRPWFVAASQEEAEREPIHTSLVGVELLTP